LGETADAAGSSRQEVQAALKMRAELRWVEAKVLDDAMEVTVLLVEQLVHQVNELDSGIATQLAEGGGAFHALVGEAVQSSEKISGADFSHDE
jgi:hypothetical protein